MDAKKSLRDVSEAEMDQFCADVRNYYETHIGDPDAFKRGKCVQGSAQLMSGIAKAIENCEDYLDLCLKDTSSISPRQEKCAFRNNRAKCGAAPTVGQVSTCLKELTDAEAAFYPLYANKTCAELLAPDAGPVPREPYPDSCFAVGRACPDLGFYTH